jgi:hypothetical protein
MLNEKALNRIEAKLDALMKKMMSEKEIKELGMPMAKEVMEAERPYNVRHGMAAGVTAMPEQPAPMPAKSPATSMAAPVKGKAG